MLAEFLQAIALWSGNSPTFLPYIIYNMKRITSILILCGLSLTMTAQEQRLETIDTVYLASKTPTPTLESGKLITVINEAQLEQRPEASVATLVNELAGIEINGSRSNAGQNLRYAVRGGSNRQVVIMVDGVQLNDPSQIANDFDLRLLPASAVSRIEVLRGASSVLYGSGAATAVISITTKQAEDKPITAQFRSVLATNRSAEGDFSETDWDSYTNHARVSGTLGAFFYNASFGNQYTDGISAIAAPEGAPAFESDVFNRYNGTIRLGVHLSEKVRFSQFLSFDKFKSDFDDAGLFDAEYQSISDQLRTGGHFQWKYKNGIYVFNDNYTWLEREISSSFPAKYDSDAYTFDNYLRHNFSEDLAVVIGLNGNFSKFNSFSVPFGETDFAQDIDEEVASFSIIDPYVNATYKTPFGLQLHAGARVNIHSDYGTHLVYQVNPFYVFEFDTSTLKVLGSYGTAYITPSLFQLYDPLYGNQELDPEDSSTIESGLEWAKGSKFRVNAVYFQRSVDNFVDFVTVDPDNFLFQYQNISETFDSKGVEVSVHMQPWEAFSFQGNYTFTEAADRFALRIPKHKANAQLQYQLWQRLQLGLRYQWVDERADSFFNSETFESETVTLDAFSLMDFTVRLSASKQLSLFATLTNIWDEEYEELFRYQTLGRNVHVGFQLNFD